MPYLSEQLSAAGVAVFPCHPDKVPAITKGLSWLDAAHQPVSCYDWRDKLVGIPIPPGVVVIDLDTYKGATRATVEQAIGCTLPWDAAMIQTTVHGGQHYAFRADWEAINGSNIGNIRGLDLRAGPGKGYICTGNGYAPAGFGPFALAYPQALIELPDACRPLMEHVHHTPATSPLALGYSTDSETALREALAHIDPGCDRRAWVKIGLALRHHYADDETAGMALFDTWSRGDLWADGCPANYVPDVMEHQWGSFKPQGDTTVASLYYEAIQAGWAPPVGFDTASAFGADGAPAVEFGALVDRIQSNGGDPKETTSLIDAVSSLACTPIQRATLLALLTRALKDVDLLTKPVRNQLELAAGGTGTGEGAMPGQYGKNQTQNALLFLEQKYPGDRLRRADQVWYAYDGRIWHEVDDDLMMYLMSVEMLSSKPQHATVSGTFKMLSGLVHCTQRIGDMPGHLIIFENGVLDLNTGDYLPHIPDYFTTNMLPYAYNPNAGCERWLTFLREIFEGDEERIALLQEWFGYLMSSSYLHHKVMLLLGVGRSGKGTIGRMIEQVVGTQNFTGGSLHSFASDSYMESLRTKKAIFIGDAEGSLDRFKAGQIVERIKSMSGNDSIPFDRKWKSHLSETLPSRISIASNLLPALFDASGVLADRMLVLTFDVSYLGRENLKLFDELLVDLEGIATWSLQGLARLNANGQFTVPAASKAEAQFMAEAYSPLREFVNDVCTVGTDQTTTCDALYAVYQQWAIAKQEQKVLARRQLIRAFKDLTRSRECRYGPHRMADGVITRGFKGLAIRDVQSSTAGAFQQPVLREVK